MVMPTNITEGKVSTEGIARIDDENVARLSKHKLIPGDIVYGRRGDIGRQALISTRENGWLCGTGCIRITLGNGPVDSTFLHYYLRDENVISYISNQAVGATMPNLNTKILRSIPVRHPDLPTQRRIAGILSAYDDLIENNLRRIRILEEMAQSLYREWFVHFRYPGHESVPLVDSPLGPIPEGWEVKEVDESFEITGGGTPSKKVDEYWDEGTIQWYSPRDLTAKGTMFMECSADQITELGLKKSSAKMFPANSVMLTSRATIGAISINTVPACTNQGFITCLPNEEVPQYFLYQWLTANVETFISHASGATFKEISKGVFRKLNFLQPAQDLVSRYEVTVTPIADQLLNLQRRNRALRQTRDLLLPKLLARK